MRRFLFLYLFLFFGFSCFADHLPYLFYKLPKTYFSSDSFVPVYMGEVKEGAKYHIEGSFDGTANNPILSIVGDTSLNPNSRGSVGYYHNTNPSGTGPFSHTFTGIGLVSSYLPDGTYLIDYSCYYRTRGYGYVEFVITTDDSSFPPFSGGEGGEGEGGEGGEGEGGEGEGGEGGEGEGGEGGEGEGGEGEGGEGGEDEGGDDGPVPIEVPDAPADPEIVIRSPYDKVGDHFTNLVFSLPSGGSHSWGVFKILLPSGSWVSANISDINSGLDDSLDSFRLFFRAFVQCCISIFFFVKSLKLFRKNS